MKLLYVITDMETGGAQRLLADMLYQLALVPDLQITLAVYSPLTKPSHILQSILNLPAIRVVSLNTPLSSRSSLNPLIRLQAIKRLRPLLREADICHVHLFPALYDAALASKGIDTPLIFTEHNTGNRRRKYRFIRPVERFIYSRYLAIIGVSQAAGHSLSNWIGHQTISPRLHIIENGIVFNRFSERMERQSLSSSGASESIDTAQDLVDRFYEGIDGETARRIQRFGINNTRDVYQREGRAILMISRFAESKDHESLIRAFHLLKNAPQFKDLQSEHPLFLAFAGTGSTMDRCKGLAKSLSLTDDILFLGERHDTPRLIAAAAVGLQISHWEGVGITALEMMAGRLPIIVSDIPGLNHATQGGALLTSNNPYAIAQRIAAVLNPGTPEDFNTMLLRIDNGEKIAFRHDISHTVDAHVLLYRQLTKFRPST